MKPSKKQPSEEAGTRDETLSEEELRNVAGGTQEQIAEQQVNIGDLPNVRVDISPM